jgi:hypothetical protein
MSKNQVAHATAPTLIEAPTISQAWARMAVHIADHKGRVISPLILSVANGTADSMLIEDAILRGALDALLKERDDYPIDIVAFTIFPQRYLDMSKGARKEFFELYRETFPRLQAMNPRLNGRGLYFERLTMFDGAPCNGNQLEWIIQQYLGRDQVRTSMFQAAIFDPRRDHTAAAQLPFPCLQHVSFIPTEEGLVLNAFYATQQVLRKSYGNYLGLIHLGRFMAREMKLDFVRFNAFVGVAKLDDIGKTSEKFRPILDASRALIPAA